MKKLNLADLDTNGYYNRTVHTCVLKLHLPLEIINDIYKNLHNKNEVSGVFYVDEDDKVTHADKNEGDTGSVYRDAFPKIDNFGGPQDDRASTLTRDKLRKFNDINGFEHGPAGEAEEQEAYDEA
jgi:hypothetical protein